MALIVKKEHFLNLFWILFFLLFFGLPFKQLNLFSIKTNATSGGISLVFLVYSHFKKLVTENHSFAIWALSIGLLFLTVMILFVIAFLLIKLFDKLNFSKIIFLRKVDDVIEKLLTTKTIYIIIFLFLMSFIPRLLYINAGLLHHDSVQTAIATEQTLETGRLHGIVGYRYGYVLINVIAYFIPHFIFGVQSSELVITMMAIIFASLSAVMLYLFVKELLDNVYIAICAALLFMFMPIYLATTTYAKDHSLSIFLILLAAYYLVKALKTDLLRYKIYLSLSLGFSLFVRISDIFASFPLFLLLYFFPEKILGEGKIKFRNRLGIKNLIIISVPLIVALILFFAFQKGAISGGIAGNKFLDVHANWLDMVLSLMMTFTTLGFFLLAYGLFCSIKENKYLGLMLFIWGIVVFLFYAGFGTSKLRFFIPMIIPISILMAICLYFMRKKYSLMSPLTLIIVVVFMFLLIEPTLAYRHNYSPGKEMALFFANASEDNAIIIDYGDLGLFYNYYAKRKSIECPFLDKPAEFNTIINSINEELDHSLPIYLNDQCFGFQLKTKEDSNNLIDFFNKNYDFLAIGKIEFENYEDIIKLSPHNFTIYRISKQRR